jgi:hypothetical protein
MRALQKTIRLMQRRILLPGITMYLGAGIIATAFCDWNRIGLAGIDVTAMTTGIDVWRNNRPIVLVGTEYGEVCSVSGSGDSIAKYPKISSGATDKPAGAIRALCMSDNGEVVFAGTDSGLYWANLNSAALPIWKKTEKIPSEPVTAITHNDSIYCAATITELYRSKSPFGEWMPCTVSNRLPSPASAPHFTSLASWWYGGFAAGSCLAAGTNAFGGVLIGGTDARQWNNMTCVVSQCVDSNVYSLTLGDSGKLFAGTSRGIFWASEFDTGTWYALSPQLTAAPVNHVCVTYDSSINAREIYASTDSGAYILSPRINASQWERFISLKVYSMVSLTPKNSRIVYAATQTGLWKYNTTTGVHMRTTKKMPIFYTTVTDVYSVNGRKISSKTRLKHLSGGVYITAQRGTKGTYCALTVH